MNTKKLTINDALPCPFCGTFPKLDMYPCVNNTYYYFLQCMGDTNHEAATILMKSEHEAVKHWNKRK